MPKHRYMPIYSLYRYTSMLRQNFKIPERLVVRTTSAVSTADGGLTPLTDICSPMIRTPEINSSDWIESKSCPRDIQLAPFPIRVQAKTNLCKISLRDGLRIDEYALFGSVDLACHYMDAIKVGTGAKSILMFPTLENKDRTTIVAIVHLDRSPLRFSDSTFHYMQSDPMHVTASVKCATMCYLP
jgi:hypothetical protein